MSTRLSVVMRTKDCEDVVGQALTGLFSQRGVDFDLLVIDSGSKDRTLEIVRGFPCRIIQIAPTEYYPGLVLNRGARETTGDILVFQNSDVVPLTATTLAELVAPFQDGAVKATFARQVPRPEAHSWVRRDYATAFPSQGDPPPWLTYSLPLAAMRRSAWLERPFYDAAWGSEDTEWGAFARRTGRVVRYVPNAAVMHSHNYTLRQIYGRRFIEGEADAFIYGGGVHLGSIAHRYLASVLHDIATAALGRDWKGALLAPARRAVYHWAYLRGRALGAHRVAAGDRDASRGQAVVLSRQ